MQWIEVSVPTRSDEIDDVCAQLAELGAGGMVVEDEADFSGLSRAQPPVLGLR